MKNLQGFLFVILIIYSVEGRRRKSEDDSGHGERDGKFLSMFQVVTFTNDPCVASGNKNGTCLTAAECSAKGGISSGTCARGYGICCLVSIECGGTSSTNGTYFENPLVASLGQCVATICPANKNICQLRLDFDSFNIAGPSVKSDAEQLELLYGLAVKPGTANAKKATLQSQCLTDQFQVTKSANKPPVICGTNNNEHSKESHVYVDVDRSGGCVDLSFILGATSILNAPIPTMRRWSIKVTQYECDFENLAPMGCSQYYFGPDTDEVKSFNYDGGLHLANQDQTICVRKEKKFCRICWTTKEPTDFSVSGDTKPLALDSNGCCGYGDDGDKTNFDCVQVPGGAAEANGNVKTQFCGNDDGLSPKTVCSYRTPFYIRFISDGYEFLEGSDMEAVNMNKGFKLTYTMDIVGCT